MDYYAKGTEDSEREDLVVVEGVFRGQFIVPWYAVECQVIHQRTMVLYKVPVDITTGDVTQIRVLTDNKITKFNIK